MIQEITKDRLKVQIYENRTQMGAHASTAVAERIRSLLIEQDFVNMIFAAAPSQNAFLAHLSEEKGVNWNRINAFNMDEYIGLDEKAPQTFGNFLRERLFNKVNLNSLHLLNGNAPDLEVECRRYTQLLDQYPADIVCLGIGENAHIAFNDPHVANFEDPYRVKVINLDKDCQQQQVNDECFTHISEVPTHALTLTIPALFSADYIYCIVPGINKAQAVYHTLNSSIKEKYPSTILRKHTNAVLYLDKDSAMDLDDIHQQTVF